MKDLEKIITKELLRRVLPKETQNLSDSFSFTINEDYIEFSDDGEMQFEYCIYKFAFKCKEWAFNNGRYVLESKSYSVKNYKFTKGAFCYTHFPMDGMGNSHWANTEVEAIFKACEWILNEVNEKGIESNKEKIWKNLMDV